MDFICHFNMHINTRRGWWWLVGLGAECVSTRTGNRTVSHTTSQQNTQPYTHIFICTYIRMQIRLSFEFGNRAWKKINLIKGKSYRVYFEAASDDEKRGENLPESESRRRTPFLCQILHSHSLCASVKTKLFSGPIQNENF